jgi:hypothetical protein
MKPAPENVGGIPSNRVPISRVLCEKWAIADSLQVEDETENETLRSKKLRAES